MGTAKLLNNLSHGSRRDLTAINLSKCEQIGNSFMPGLKLSNEYFVSLDEADLTQPRQPDGNLPVIKFLQPAEENALPEFFRRSNEPLAIAMQIRKGPLRMNSKRQDFLAEICRSTRACGSSRQEPG